MNYLAQKVADYYPHKAYIVWIRENDYISESEILEICRTREEVSNFRLEYYQKTLLPALAERRFMCKEYYDKIVTKIGSLVSEDIYFQQALIEVIYEDRIQDQNTSTDDEKAQVLNYYLTGDDDFLVRIDERQFR